MSDPDPVVEALIEAVRAAVRNGTLTAKQVVKLLENVMDRGERRQPPPEHGTLLSCSFCAKSQTEVRKLIAGPEVYICDQCIRLCNDIIAEEEGTGADPPA